MPTILTHTPTDMKGQGMNLNAIELKTGMPSRDFALSLQFYETLGFDKKYDDDIAYFAYGDHISFLL